MAKKDDVMSVFEALEKAFSGEKEYDDVLMELDLHTAQVRKACPHLFVALSNKNGGVQEQQVITFADQLRRMIQEQAQNELPSNSFTTSNEVGHEPPPTALPAINWSEWAPTVAHQTNTSDISLVRWDVPNVPAPGLGQTVTLRGAVRRTRLSVIESRDDGVLKMQTIAILPPSSGG